VSTEFPNGACRLRSCSGGCANGSPADGIPGCGRRCARAQPFRQTFLMSTDSPRHGRCCTRAQAFVRTPLLSTQFLGCVRCCARAQAFGEKWVSYRQAFLKRGCYCARIQTFGRGRWERFSWRWNSRGAAAVVLVLRRSGKRVSCAAVALVLSVRENGSRVDKNFLKRGCCCARAQAFGQTDLASTEFLSHGRRCDPARAFGRRARSLLRSSGWVDEQSF
jgi:hypothetical protein